MQNSDRTLPFVTISGGRVTSFLHEEVFVGLNRGWRAVRFECCFSVLLVTVRRQSPVILTENWQDRYLRGLGYSAIALLFGPWGLPWGPLWTARAIWTNLTGGVDVSDQVASQLEQSRAQGVGSDMVARNSSPDIPGK